MEKARLLVEEYLTDSLEDLNAHLQKNGLRPTILQTVNVFDDHPAILFLLGTERVEMGRIVATFRLMTSVITDMPTEERTISIPCDAFGYPVAGTRVQCAFDRSTAYGRVRHVDGGCWDIQWQLPDRP